MTVQIDHGRVDIERIRQQMQLDMKRLDEEIAGAKKLYSIEIWKVAAASAAAGAGLVVALLALLNYLHHF